MAMKIVLGIALTGMIILGATTVYLLFENRRIDQQAEAVEEGVRRALDPALTAPEPEPELDTDQAIEPLPLNADAAARELAARISYRYCGTSFEVQDYEYRGGVLYVPRCLDRIGPYDSASKKIGDIEIGVLATEYGPPEIMEWGATTCYVDVYATTQNTLCLPGDD